MSTLTSRQTIGRHCNGSLGPSGSVISPYFQRTLSGNMREKVNPDGDNNLSLSYMDFLIDSWGVAGGNPYIIISWWNSSNVFQNSDLVFMTFSDVRTNGLTATATTAINAYGTTNSITVSSIRGLPGTLAGAPQAAIANAPADAVTNYNVVTTLLGAVTSAVNTANDKQNQIATQLNSLLTELRTLGIIAT